MQSKSQIDQALRQKADAREIPGVVAIAATGKETVYQGAFGRRDISKDDPMTADSVFWIASMTKAVTSAAAMQLVEQGKLSLDEPIGKVLPDLAKPQVLEPIVNLEVFVPDAHMGDVTGGLAGKRARISGTDSLRGGEIVIKAQVPLAEVTDYQTELKAMTGGQGRYAIEFSHYDAVPAQVQKQLAEAYKPKVEEE